MAHVVCSSCGARVARTDAICTHCGLELSWQDSSSARLIECKACRHKNPEVAKFCLSCGAGLSREVEQTKLAEPDRQPARKKERPKETAPSARKFEHWQIASVVAFLALISFLAYNEVTRQSTRLGSSASGPPTNQSPRAMVDLTPLEQAVAVNPNDPGSVIHLANGLQDNGLYLRAVDMYKKYLAVRPKDPDARVDLGICYYQLGIADTANAGRYYGLAMSEMQQAHTDAPQHQPAVFNMGVVSLQLGNLQESNRWFELAAKMNPASELGKRAQQMLQQHQVPQ
jgi:tetratricopeptide (TPR) repeat protein